MRQVSLWMIAAVLIFGPGCGGDSSSKKVREICVDMAISAPTPPGGVYGDLYSWCPSVAGGVTPVTWSIGSTGGSLPPGLVLDPGSGCIEGIPDTPGSYTFDLWVCDSCPQGQRCDKKQLTIDVACLPPPLITTTSLPAASAGMAYNECFTAVDGTAPLLWSIVPGSGNLPPGLGLDSSTGCISGTPTAQGVYTFDIELCDSCALGPLCDQQTFTVDVGCADPYEPNDDIATAYDISAREMTWLSSILGLGTADNDDWYEIDVTSNFNHMTIDLTFVHASGNIDVELLDAVGNVLFSENTLTDDEHLEFDVDPAGGTHYIRVFPVGGATCNSYDMWWDDTQPPPPPPPPDDNYEENDDYTTAYDLTLQKQVWLSTINGIGVANDDDFYEILLDPNAVEIQIDCTFVDALGDIDLALWDAGGTRLTSSTSTTDNESIRYAVSSGGGTYYIRVYPFTASAVGNTYDLLWDEMICPDDPYEPNNDVGTATDLSGLAGILLSGISGLGTARNDDYYEILVQAGLNRVSVDCYFLHSGGDINLQLLDPLGNVMGGAYSLTDDELMDVVVTPGTYYIRVTPVNPPICTGNTYDLVWDGMAP